MHRWVRSLVLAAGVALVAPAALAHAVGARIEPQTPAVVIAFAYASGEGISFGEVTVTAPDGRVHQKGRADREGRFAVAVPPDATPGQWTAQIDDGQGHRTRLDFTPDSPDRAAALRRGATQVMGLSSALLLLANLVLLALFSGRKGQGRSVA